MKKIITLIAIIALASCSKDCDEQIDALDRQYHQSLQNAITPEAKAEITRQYNERKADLDC